MTSITLALKTLGSFDFEGHSLTQFVKHCAEHYLSSEYKEIRMEAVQTCARLLTPLLTVSCRLVFKSILKHIPTDNGFEIMYETWAVGFLEDIFYIIIQY